VDDLTGIINDAHGGRFHADVEASPKSLRHTWILEDLEISLQK
jgi:hypothetical protein